MVEGVVEGKSKVRTAEKTDVKEVEEKALKRDVEMEMFESS